jgi:predicted permease
MTPTDGFRRRFRMSDHAPDIKRDVNDEIAFHLEMRERELIALGVPPDEARRQARAAFGDGNAIAAEVESIDDARVRRQRLGEIAQSVLQDARFTLRGLVRNPGFAAAALLTLALGIGANAMVFGLMEAILLRAPSVQSPDALAAVYTTCRAGNPRCASSHADYLDYRERTRAFDDLAAYDRQEVAFGDTPETELVTAELVSGNYFSVLGVSAIQGRTISPDDDRPPSGLPVAVLSHDFWRTRFAEDRGVVGRTIRLNSVPYTVIGIAAPSFHGLRLGALPAVWVPIHGLPTLLPSGTDPTIFEDRGSRWIDGLVARLAEGASVDGARAELLGVSRQLAQEDSVARGPRTVTVDPLPSYVLPPGTERVIASFVWVLQGVVAVTLLLACANLANLLLARSLARRRELAVRAAIGAGRGRIVRQLLTESLVLAVLGGAIGLAVAALALSLVSSFQLPFGFDIAAVGAGINSRVVVFTGVLALITTVAFGTIPALHATRDDVANLVRGASPGRGPRAGRMLGTLVGVQVALCVTLLAGAGLFLRTLRNHLDVDLGFRPDGVAVAVIDPSLTNAGADANGALVRDLIARAAALPGVEAASVGARVPVLAQGSGFFVRVDGYTPAPDEEMRVEVAPVAPDYFRALGLPLLRGRDFADRDGPGAGRVIIVSEQTARAWWPGREPIGGTVTIRNQPHTVIAVAGNVPGRGLETVPTANAYVPLSQNVDQLPRNLFVVSRAAPARVDGLLPLMRRAVHEVDPRISVASLLTMRRAISTTLAPQRGAAALLSVLAALALLLASVGIYGVVAYGVAQRRRDFGIRMALGARGRALVSLVARGMLIPVVVGAGVGLLTAAVAGRALRGLIFGVAPTDPLTLAGAVSVLAVAAAVATLGPARRAARTDPMEIMRAE